MKRLAQPEAAGCPTRRPAASRPTATTLTRGWGPNRYVTLVASLFTLPAGAFALWPRAAEFLQFDRAALAAGELWRIFSAHWTHWNFDHLLWDLLAFAILIPLCWSLSARRTLTALALSAPAISLAVWIGLPQMQFYRGLSGLDSTLFVLAAGLLYRQARRNHDGSLVVWSTLAMLAFAAKLAFELLSGTTAFADSSTFVPVPLAHIVGGSIGALAAWISRPNR